MNRSQAKERIIKLRELINDYRYHYHVLNESIMSEEAADSLKHELAQLESKYPDLISNDSPTQRIAGAILPGFNTYQHSSRMLSLNDVFNKEEVQAWINRINKVLSSKDITYFMDIKMDGLACALIYRDGVLERGVTRGDGFTGEDVTANIRTMESIPLSLKYNKDYALFYKGVTEVRGEIVMYKKDFEMLNKQRKKEGLPLFANPRNTAAGTIRQLDSKLVATRPLYFRAYDLLREDTKEVDSYSYAYKVLAAFGFITNPMASSAKDIKGIMDFIEYWTVKRLDLEFNTDGVVIKLDDRQSFSNLGVAGKAPRGAVAFKYAAEQATTIVKDIFVSIGRTGTATPVAVLEPVVIAGSTVQMATLHNEGEVKRKDIRIKDHVIVHKAGDIIPEVVEALPQLRTGIEREFKMPDTCPECKTKLIKNKVADAAWRCPNTNCPSRTWKRIQHYASKEALDIEGLGEKNVIALIKASLINDPADIYLLEPVQLMKLERFAAISAKKLVESIQSKKNPSTSRFLYGLGIRHVGVQTAIDLANHFKNIDVIINAKVDDLAAVEGVGSIVAESIAEYFAEPKNIELLKKFRSYGVWPYEAKNIEGNLSNKSFVITGTLTAMQREEAADRIRNLGGTFKSAVTEDTTYLVVGENPGKSKLKQAETLNTTVIDEDEFYKLLTR